MLSGCKISFLVFFGLFFSYLGSAQHSDSSSVNKARLRTVVISEAVGYSITMIGLNELWYADFERSSFHFFDDSKEWLQLDKAGHAITAYQVGRAGREVLDWAGVPRKKAIWYGGTFGLAFLTSVEVLDGFSSEWGFSVADGLSNAVGSGLYIGQELLWDEQRFSLKFSYHLTGLAQYRPNTLGSTWNERIIKDYNGQTYWLSANIASFLREESRFPKWFNIALGYGAYGMLGGFENPVTDSEGNRIPSIDRYRQYYLSLDVDLTRIKTRSKFFNTVLGTFAYLKFPFPALEYNEPEGLIFKLWHY